MDPKRTKEYHLAMLNHALKELDTGLTERAAILSLIDTFDCHKSTAHRVVKKAAAVRSGARDPNHWGGRREGSGRSHNPGDPVDPDPQLNT